MSRRRYISSDMSADAEIAELTEYGLLPVLLYTWAIPHMDDWGRMTGESRQFKLLVCPALDVTVKEVEEALQQITNVGLWMRYESEGKKYIAIPKSKWFKYQSYINKGKRDNDRQSAFPRPPMDSEWQSSPPNTADRRNDSSKDGGNTEEEQGEPQIAVSPSPSPTPSPSPSPSPSKDINDDDEAYGRVMEFYQNNIGTMAPSQYEYVEDWLKTYDADVLIYAIRRAVDQGVPKWAYVNKTLVAWQNSGAKTLKDCEAQVVQHERSKEGKYGKHRTGTSGNSQTDREAASRNEELFFGSRESNKDISDDFINNFQ